MNVSPLKVDDHLLWPDGTISVDPSTVVDYIFKLNPHDLARGMLCVTSMTPEIIEYNAVADFPLQVKTDCALHFPPHWSLPEPYKYLDLDAYLLGLADRVERDGLYEQRLTRLATEIYKYRELKLDDVLRTLIYVLDVMREKKVIWGVGRGSSCSSYLLYLLGLHEVDPVKYDVEFTDFIR